MATVMPLGRISPLLHNGDADMLTLYVPQSACPDRETDCLYHQHTSPREMPMLFLPSASSEGDADPGRGIHKGRRLIFPLHISI